MMQILLGILSSYLIGSIPTAYILGRLLKGIDIRKFGSGNVGATNALRVLGKKAGILVLLLDVLKGFIPVFFIVNLVFSTTALVSEETLGVILGISGICGHNWTIFLNFKGGKGVATTFGVLIGLAVKTVGLAYVVGVAVAIWISVFLVSRIVSLSSILAAASFPLLAIIFGQSPMVIGTGILLSIFILMRHRSNFYRILQGKESRVTFKKKLSSSG
ncbi:MAG: glycerol-3-phosphate 1-O-acyltransferase PlsY [Candidatus Omnitrophica bacterium]|nr:glycerol-3-phosphate 1-O-acyltransferase PlsY [Candidatus Omnitrophota bacterium]